MLNLYHDPIHRIIHLFWGSVEVVMITRLIRSVDNHEQDRRSRWSREICIVSTSLKFVTRFQPCVGSPGLESGMLYLILADAMEFYDAG